MNEHAALVERVNAALELEKRYSESKLTYYWPCCRSHMEKDDKGNPVPRCPTTPCPDSTHAKFHSSLKRVRLILGGNRSGKSISGLNELLMRACFKSHPFTKLKNPSGGQYRIYCPDFSLIEKNLIPKMKEWIPISSLKGPGKTKEEKWENSYDKKYHILYLKDSRMIDLMSYDQQQSKSESVELDGTWLDEEAPEEIYSAVEARSISRGGKIWITVTPLYGFTWGMKFLDTSDPNVEVFQFDIYDNPYNTDEAIKNFELSLQDRPHEREARLHGRFIELQGLVYKELSPQVHLINSAGKYEGYPVIFTMDPHPRKPTVMTWAYVTPKDDLVFFDELEVAGTARDVASSIRAKESGHQARTLFRLIDPAAKAQGNNLAFETDTLKEFEREGLSFSLADNSEAGYGVVKEYLTHDPSRPMSTMNRPRMFFTRDCPKTWYGMTHLLWDDWALKRSLRDERERVKDYKKDFPDCVRYTAARRPTTRSFSNVNPSRLGGTIRSRPLNSEQAQHRREIREFVFGGRRG